MSTGLKAILVVAGIVCLFGVTTVLVRAASSGEDFSWLSVSEGGIWIGDSGSEGESVPEPNTLEFIQDESRIKFSGEDSEIVFTSGGQISGAERMDVLSTGSTVVAAGTVIGETLYPASGMFVATEPVVESMSAGILSASGDVGISSGVAIEENFYPIASVLCTLGGDVIIQLGSSQAMRGESTPGGDDELSALSEESLAEESNRNPVTTGGYSGKLPQFYVPALTGSGS